MMVPPDPIQHIRERLDSHIDTEDADRVEIRERLVRVEVRLDDMGTKLTRLVDRSENAFKTYGWPLVLILATALTTYVTTRIQRIDAAKPAYGAAP